VVSAEYPQGGADTLELPTDPAWYRLSELADGTVRIEEPHNHEMIRANSWLVRGRDRDLLVDTGLGVSSLRSALQDHLDKPLVTLASHTHLDHVGSMHEFETRLVHSLEAEQLARHTGLATLTRSGLPPDLVDALAEAGMPLPRYLIDALPAPGYDLESYRIEPAPPTQILEDGDVIDLGDRSFEVLHLPGHSPGQIAVWEASRGTFFAADVIYDGPIVDAGLPGTSIPDYIKSMRRLRELPVEVVHPGHYGSFGRERMIELADEYLAFRNGSGQ
jgi:glyoxylase-like metal-dependent hydrolase (beta-lactamase superfamily II)